MLTLKFNIMARPKSKNLTIFEKLQKKESIDYSEYTYKQLGEAIEEIFNKYVEERDRKVSLKDLENVKKLCDKLGESVNKLISPNTLDSDKAS